MPPLTAPRRIDARFIARATGPRAIVTAGNFAKAAFEISARVFSDPRLPMSARKRAKRRVKRGERLRVRALPLSLSLPPFLSLFLSGILIKSPTEIITSRRYRTLHGDRDSAALRAINNDRRLTNATIIDNYRSSALASRSGNPPRDVTRAFTSANERYELIDDHRSPPPPPLPLPFSPTP